jgi:alpha,alpha-trehalase
MKFISQCGIRRRLAGSIASLFILAALSASDYAGIRLYIKQSWTALRRSNAELIKSAEDSKTGKNRAIRLYVSEHEDLGKITSRFKRELTPSVFQNLRIQKLAPESIFSNTEDQGLLYLPKPYIVPGGRFNEMYGWDSYFILLGLVRDGQLRLARDMTDNCIYEVKHYGKVLNANRSYYLSRSQPPFLTRMILEVFSRTGDVRWLRDSLPSVERYHEYWTRGPHLTTATGLSRYYGGENTPAPEVVAGERDAEGKSYYDRVREYYETHVVNEYDSSLYYDREHDLLTPLFYNADRAMRESGFDVSWRFGPFSAAILDYNPIDLNCLLYRMEMDAAAICTILDQPQKANLWSSQAQQRATLINRLMWNDRAGLYFDYDYQHRRQSDVHFITTFYPLWAGIASPDQAARVESSLSIFERDGGLQTSDRATGSQWDAPFGWAPMQVIATQGLRRYGFSKAADRVATKFLSMIIRDFSALGTIVEKYDVVASRSELAGKLKYGYQSNEIGFGWTNAAYIVLSEELPSGSAIQQFRSQQAQ